MIKPEELRRNNLVEYDGKIFKVKTISDYIISADRGKGLVDFTYKEINTIELTEEWLLKLGFDCKKNEYFISGFDRFNVFLTVKNTYIFCVDEKSMRYVKNVHELQNLFFALTGEELTIK